MFKKKRVIFALVFIFTAGLATGYYIAEYGNHSVHLLGNPFSRQALSDKIFHTEEIDFNAIDTEKKSEIELVISKNINIYEESLELFRIETSYIYESFLADLKTVLPTQEFEKYEQAVKNKQRMLEKRFKHLTAEAKLDDNR